MVDIAKSNELFRQSAEAGYQTAYSRMAQIYFNGKEVERNIKIAKYWAWLDFANLPEDSRNNSILVKIIPVVLSKCIQQLLMIPAFRIHFIHGLDVLEPPLRHTVRAGLQFAVGCLIKLGIGKGCKSDPFPVGAVILPVVVGTAVRVIIQHCFRIGFRKLASLPVLPDDNLHLAAEFF